MESILFPYIEIQKILESINLEKHLASFVENEIDFQTFLSLEDKDLKDMEINALGPRKKILLAIQKCKEGCVTPDNI